MRSIDIMLGTRADLARIFEAERPHEVLIAVPTATPAEIRAIVRTLEAFRVPIKTLPRLRDIVDGHVELSQIRSLSLEDLIQRKPIDLDIEPVRRLANGRRVLVTGAGGSIGSELARQLADYGPSQLILLERYENSLFELTIDLTHRFPNVAYRPVVADVTDVNRIREVFETYRPEVVFHAAAHKHVPLMEQNICEAIRNNVRGTRVVAEAALASGCAEMVLISTDKAVNPSSVMGATKRVAEMIIWTLNRGGGTRFVAVRFGNVLGSNGSAVRVFSDQIARGGPVTVTHPEITRYFMLISEAVQLVLHAAAGAEAGAIFVLDMGEPMKVLDLARNLIRLSGFVPDEEIEIRFVGLRPGEKLTEQLWEEAESVEPSSIEKVWRLTTAPVAAEVVRTKVARLEAAAEAGQDLEVLALLTDLVPTFRPGAPDAVRNPTVVPLRRNQAEGASRR